MKYIEFKQLEDLGFRAIYTTKECGNMKDKLNLEKLINDLSIPSSSIVKGVQTHSANIQIIEDDTNIVTFENTDGYICNSDKYNLLMYYADCLPIFLVDKKTKVFGLLHAGWRGSVAKILEAAIKIFIEKFNSKIEDILVVYGVCISADKYEIKEDLVEKLKKSLNFDNMIIRTNGKIYLDLKKLNTNIALSLGIEKKNIYTNEYCTYTGNHYSYRDGDKESRNIALIGRK